MRKYLHRILGLYATRLAAETVIEDLVRHGLSRGKIRVFEPGRGAGGHDARADSDDVLNEMLREGLIGMVIGIFAGAAGTFALMIAKASLFASSPVLGAVIMLGWGASIGMLVGALAGARSHQGKVADLLKVSLASGYVVLVAHADNEEQTTSAQQIIGQSMVGFGSPAVFAS